MVTNQRTRPLCLSFALVLLYWSAQYIPIAPTGATPQLRIPYTSLVLSTARNGSHEKPTHHAHMRERCESSSDATLIDYERLVYCTQLRDSLPLARTVLVVLLVVLLYLLSSTADSFFCPVLQAIVEKYRIPPDIAGVTFLSFGNGSPDVFSNIAAFSTATPKIGVASILGGGLLVTTVIAASVGMASQDQDQLIPRKFVRDVVFYFIAISYLCFVFFDGTVGLGKALGFLLIYVCYVAVILLDKPIARLYYSLMDYELDEFEELDPAMHLLARPYYSGSSWSDSDKSASDSEERPATPIPAMITDYDVFRIPNYNLSDSEQSDTSSAPLMPSLYRKSSAPTPRSKKVDLFSQGESLPLLWRQRTPAARPASVCIPSLSRPKRPRSRTAWESTQLSAHTNLTAKRWTRWYHQLNDIAEVSGISETEIDDEEGGRDKESLSPHAPQLVSASLAERYLFRWFRAGYYLFDRFVWNPLEFGTTFIRRLTIPLLDEETWDKTFTMACPPCAILLAGISVFSLNPLSNLYFAGTIVLCGGGGSIAVYLTASPTSPPEGKLLAPYICMAFVMSVIWIMSIANEVLALLEVLGGLFGLSNSVLGVSVLAWGNSIGDLVSNTSIARDGFPTMAFAGCFAGPMFNLLVGIGLALTIAILSRGPIYMGNASSLVYIGFGYLFASLIINLSLAALDGFRYRMWLCTTLLILYASFVAISIAVVVMDEEA